MAGTSLGTAFIRVRGDLTDLKAQLVSTLAPTKLNKLAKGAGLAIGAGLAAGGAGAGLFKLGKQFDQAFDTIRVGSGKTGESLKGLEDDFESVLKTTPTDFATAGDAIAQLNQRLGLSGKPLRELSTQLLNLSRLTKTDLSQNIASVARAFEDWEVPVERQTKALDGLFRLGQRSGASVQELATNVQKFGSPLRILGFSLGEAAATFATFERAGVNIQTTVPGLKLAISNLTRPSADLGKAMENLGISATSPEKGLRQVFALLSKESDLSNIEKRGLAMDVFGKRAGADMAEAIRQGRFEVDEMFKTFAGGGDTISKAEKDTRDFSEEWQLLKNRLAVGLEPLATGVFKSIGEMLKIINDPKLSGAEKWDRISAIISNAFQKGFEAASKAAVEFGPKIAAALFRGFLNAPPLVQLLGGAWLLKRAAPMLASAGLLGRSAGTAFSAGMATTVATGAGGAAAGGAAGGLAAFGAKLARFAKVGVGVATGAAILEGIRLRLQSPDAGLEKRLKQLQAPGVLGIRKIIGGAQNLVAKIPGVPKPGRDDFGPQIEKSKELAGILRQLTSASGERIPILQRQADEVARQLKLTQGQKTELASMFRLKATGDVARALGGLSTAAGAARDALPGVVAAQKQVNDLRKQGKTDTHAYAVAVRALDAAEATRNEALRSREGLQRKVLDATKADLSTAIQTFKTHRRLGASQGQLAKDMNQVEQAASRQHAALANVSRATRGLTPIAGAAGTKMGELLKSFKGIEGVGKFKKFLVTADISSVEKGITVASKLQKLGRGKTVMRIFADSKTPEEAIKRLQELLRKIERKKTIARIEARDEATLFALKVKRGLTKLFENPIKAVLDFVDPPPPRRRAMGGRVSESLSLVGEEGFELAKLPTGKTALLGQGGPEIVALPDQTRVIPHPESKRKLAATTQKVIQRLVPASIPQLSPLVQSVVQDSGTDQGRQSPRPLLPRASGAASGPRFVELARKAGVLGFASGGAVGKRKKDAKVRDKKTTERLRERLGRQRFERLKVDSLVKQVGSERVERFVERLGPQRFSRLVESEGTERVSDRIQRESRLERFGGDRLREKFGAEISVLRDRTKESKGLVERTDRERLQGSASRLVERLGGLTTRSEHFDRLREQAIPLKQMVGEVLREKGSKVRESTVLREVTRGGRTLERGGTLREAVNTVLERVSGTEGRKESPRALVSKAFQALSEPRFAQSLAATKGFEEVESSLAVVRKQAPELVERLVGSRRSRPEFVRMARKLGIPGFAKGGTVGKEPTAKASKKLPIRELLERIWTVAAPFYGQSSEAAMPPTGIVKSFQTSTLTDAAGKGERVYIHRDDARGLLRGKARDMSNVVHEWAHYFQNPKLRKDWKVEGGAEAFARSVAPDIYGALEMPYASPPLEGAYAPFVRWVRKEKGQSWVMRGQFGKERTDQGGDSDKPGRRLAKTSQLAGVSVTPAEVTAITQKWGVNRAVASIGAAVKDKFPLMDIISGFRSGATTKSGSRSNHAIRAALDLGARGSLNRRIGSWVRSNFPASLRGVTEGVLDIGHDPNPPDHADHVHVAASGSQALTKVMEAIGGDGPGEKKKPRRFRKLSLGQYVTVAKKVDFPDPALAAAVFYAESMGKVNAENKTDREWSLGGAQINVLAHKRLNNERDRERLQEDIFFNFREAKKISKGGKDFTPWTMFTNKRYRDFLHGRAASLPKGSSKTPSGSSYADLLEMKILDSEDTLRPSDDLKWINRALRYWRGVYRRNKRAGNFARATEAKGQINTLKDKRKALKEGDEETVYEELGSLGPVIGEGLNTFDTRSFENVLSGIQLDKAKAALTLPRDDDSSQAGIATSLTDDIDAKSRFAGVWEQLYNLTQRFVPSKGVFKFSTKQLKALKKPKTLPERFALAKQFVDEGLKGTVEQQIDAANALAAARNDLKGDTDEAGRKEESVAVEAVNKSEDFKFFASAFAELLKTFGSNIKPIQKFAKGGTVKRLVPSLVGEEGPELVELAKHFKPSLAVVGQEGPEVVNLPIGSRVRPHPESKRIAEKMGIPGFAQGGVIKMPSFAQGGLVEPPQARVREDGQVVLDPKQLKLLIDELKRSEKERPNVTQHISFQTQPKEMHGFARSALSQTEAAVNA